MATGTGYRQSTTLKCQPKHRYCCITTGITVVWRIIS